MSRHFTGEHFTGGDPREGWVIPGPWFSAMFNGGECVECGERIQEGEEIRADGEGGYQHRDCADEDEDQEEFDPFDEIE